MAADDHNPSRRALLGAAVGFPLVAVADGTGGAPGPLHHASHAPSLRSGEEWEKAFAVFEAAEAAVRAIEAATSGYGLEEEEALLPAHDSACEAMDVALGRLMLVPVPDLTALALKFEAAFDHELKSAPDDDLRFRALLTDIIRLWGAERQAGAAAEGQR